MSEAKLHLQDVPLQTSDNEDDFSDIEQNINDTSFQLQINKNQTATSNFKSNFTVLKQHQLNLFLLNKNINQNHSKTTKTLNHIHNSIYKKNNNNQNLSITSTYLQVTPI